MSKKTKRPTSGAAKTNGNPFDTIHLVRKFDVLGKRRSGEDRRVTLSRSIAIEKRKKTLLKEYEQRGKSSKFLDKRIGERDDTLSEFDKGVMRLQRERLSKLKKKKKFNLSDDDDGEDFEMHQVGSLAENDDFQEDIPLNEDSDDEGNNVSKQRLSLQSAPSSSGVSGLHGEEEEIHKSKKQVMMEIISKSKYFRLQKAKQKEENEDLTEKLDADFASLAHTNALLSLTQPEKINALNSLLPKDKLVNTIPEDSLVSAGRSSDVEEKPDAYDKLVKEMVMDLRARPSDRTKTPEEIAQEERECLEKLEKERQKRMLATDESSDGDTDGDGEKLDTILKSSKPASGDDLGDDFCLNESNPQKKGWVDEILERDGQQDDESGEESDDEEASDGESEGADGSSDTDSVGGDLKGMPARDWEQSDDEDASVGEGSGHTNQKELKNDHKLIESEDPNNADASDKMPQGRDDLPFVIEAPANLTELSALLDNRSEIEVAEAINRIRVCNSIKLSSENKRKMQVFYGVLLQYFAVSAKTCPVNVKIINALVKPLIEMSGEIPFFAAICARQRLIRIRQQLSEEIKIPGRSSWPSLKTLLLLRLWSLIFPCSDFRHVVTTPLLLLMCEYMMRCPILFGRDIAIGSFLCSMVLVLTKISRRFCPEAVMFLQTLLASCIKQKPDSQIKNKFGDQLLNLKIDKPWLHIDSDVRELNRLDIFTIMGLQVDSMYFTSDDFKASVLLCLVETTKGFVRLYEHFSSFPELFSPIAELMLLLLENQHLPESLKTGSQEVIEMIRNKTDQHHLFRRPLQMKKKLKPIKLLNPKFEENYIKGINYDPDRERAQRKKLAKRHRSEKKGAIRELRKDNYFIAAAKEIERKEQEKERAEKFGKAMAFLQEQEHAFKSGQLGKGQKRKR